MTYLTPSERKIWRYGYWVGIAVGIILTIVVIQIAL